MHVYIEAYPTNPNGISNALSEHLHIVIGGTIFVARGLVRDGFFLQLIRGIIPSHVAMLVDLGLALVAIRRVLGLNTSLGEMRRNHIVRVDVYPDHACVEYE